MANLSNLSVTVNAKVSVPDETAERCMRLLEMWMDDNPDKTIICERLDGEDRVLHQMSIVDRWSKKDD